MKISELLKKEGRFLSMEVFPPKSDTGFNNIKEATGKVAELKPAFLSVTYGAGGSTRKYTLDIAKNISENYRVTTLAHLTCVGSTEETVSSYLKSLKECGIDNVLALRGDLPEGMTKEDLEFRHASELTSYIRKENSDICVGGACYPEVHPESANQIEDINWLRAKVEAGCEFLTTQMFFDNNILYNFMYKIQKAGIDVPVIPGIMPITNAAQINRVVKLSSASLPQRFKNLVDYFGTDEKAMTQSGIAYATDQIIDLFANGFKVVHIYTMNKPFVAQSIMNNLSDIISYEY